MERNQTKNSRVWTGIFSLSLAMPILVTGQDAQGVKPSGAAGMATSIPNTDGRQMQLMQARAQSREARKDSDAAALARSADQALESRNNSTALEDARRLKQLKQQAARQMEFEKSQNAYKKVSSNDISLWATRQGGIKVERDRAPQIANYLDAPPQQAMAPAQTQPQVVADEESGGFSPFKKIGGAAKKLNPFNKEDEVEPGLRVPEPGSGSTKKEKDGGLLKKMPLIGGLGKKDDQPSGIRSEMPIEEEKKGFLKNLGKKKDQAEAAPEVVATEEKKGFLKKVGSNIPFIGKKGDESTPVVGPADTPQTPVPGMQSPVVNPVESPVRVESTGVADGISRVSNNNVVSAPQQPQGVVTNPDAVPASIPVVEEKPGFMGRLKNAGNRINPFSKDEAVGIASAETGVAQPGSISEDDKPGFMNRLLNRDQNAAEAAPNATPAVAANTAVEEEKPGLMDRFRNMGGGVGNGQNKVSGAGSIDASLFPSGSTSSAPTGGDLQSVTNPSAAMAANTGPTGELAGTPPAQQLPGEEKKKFSLPKIEIAVPDFSEVGKPDPTVPKVWKERTTAHKGGSSYYVVSSATNFMRFGSGQFSSDTIELSAGTIVKMTKPGDEWASVQLADGSQGILKNKALRPANQAEIPASFGTGASAAGVVSQR